MTEIELLKAQADQLGIPYKANIGVETLRSRIHAKLEGTEDTADADADVDGNGVPAAAENNSPQLTKAQRLQATRDRQMKEMTRLIRVRINCLNPLKGQLKGEIVTVANSFVGTVRKFIPFGEATDNGYHVPKILLDELKARRFNSVQTRKGPNGEILPNQRLVPEFSIEELEPLTKEDLAKLAAAQKAAAGLE